MKPKAKRDIYRVGRWLLPSIWVIGTFFSGLVIDKLIPAQGLTFQWQKGLILLTSMSLLGAVVLGTGLLIERWRIHRHRTSLIDYPVRILTVNIRHFVSVRSVLDRLIGLRRT